MAKRFTATEKWQDPWFCALSERDKLFWFYMLDTCDHAGIWRKNDMLISVYFPAYDFNLERFGGRIQKLTDEKYHIPKFILFQYGTLNPANRSHASVLNLLKKEGLEEAPYKDLPRSLLGAKVKDKDKVKVKDMEEGMGETMTGEDWAKVKEAIRK